MYLLAFGMPGGFELVLIGVALLVLFGASRIPDLARNLGSGVSEFKKGVRESRQALAEDDDTSERNNLLSSSTDEPESAS